MSQLYPDLISTFPESVDTINNFVDITLATLPLAKEYYAKYNAGDIVGANKILEANPQLKYSQINASTLNPIVDSIKAMERFYMSDVQQYLMSIVKIKGDFSNSVKYTKYNIVYYNAIPYMAVTDNIPIGTLPTNLAYWYSLAIKGDKGESGLGLTPRGTWGEYIQYYQNDLVSYNNALWSATEDNIGYYPNDSSKVWYSVLSMNIAYSSLKIQNSEIDAILDGSSGLKDDNTNTNPDTDDSISKDEIDDVLTK